MRYAMARIEQEDRDMAYRIYITDSLKAIGGFSARYIDLIDKGNNSSAKEEDPEAIIERLKKKLGELE